MSRHGWHDSGDQSGAFQQAMRWGWITRNPVPLATAPGNEQANVRPPDVKQVERLLDVATAEDPELGLFLRLAVVLGAAVSWTEGDEALEETARREVEEETGWTPLSLTRLTDYDALPGLADLHFTMFRADGARHLGVPSDGSEASRVEWVPSPISASSSMTARSPTALR